MSSSFWILSLCGGVACELCSAVFVNGLVGSTFACGSIERVVLAFEKWAAICVGIGSLVGIFNFLTTLSS